MADRAADSSGELAFAVEQLIGHDLDGRYRVEALLGKGGMGAVLRARHTFMDQPVAIKVLRPTLARDPAAARRFAREARGTFQVDSEHAVKVSDFGCTADGLLYMVLELIEGHTVGDELAREGRLAPRRAVHIARQVALALAAAHRVGLIHRDLKPDNLMLVRRGGDPDFVKVLDFGLVKVIEGAGQRALSMAALTQGDIVFGTPDYMAPEQALGQALDQRADLYALGATLFEMITGRPLFEAANAMEILVAHVRQAPARLAEAAPGVAIEPDLEALVARLLAKAPGDRPGSALEVADALAAIEGRLTGPAARAHAQTVDLPSLATAVSVLAPAGASPVSPPELPAPGDASPPMAPAPAPVAFRAAPLEAGASAGRPTLSLRDLDDELAEARRPARARVFLIIALVMGALLALVVMKKRGARRGAGVARAVVVDAGAPVRAAVPVDAGAAPEDAAARPPVDASRAPAPRAPDLAELERHLAAAEAARRAGNSLKQLAEADLALDRDPRNARARYLMGDALVTTGDVANGCRYLRSARRIPAAAARLAAAGCPAD